MNISELLKSLCEADNPADIAANQLRLLGSDVDIDPLGSVCGTFFSGEDKPTLLLDAHIDEIGLVVTYIDENGFVKPGKRGGVDTRTLPASAVTIHGSENIRGVVCTQPPHVKKDTGKSVSLDDLFIDTGYSKAELEKRVSLGDFITPDVSFVRLTGNVYTGKAIDDRAGVVAVLYAMYLLKEKHIKYNLRVCFSVMEETGGAGATVAAFRSKADFAVAVDVSFGKCPATSEEETAPLGSGVMLGRSPVLDAALFSEMKATCEREQIPFNVEVMSGKTGTNADDINKSRGGIRTALLSIPIRNMHTAVEVADVTDIENTARCIAAFIEG